MSQQQQQDGEQYLHLWSALQDIRPHIPDSLYSQVEQELGFGGKSKAAENTTRKEFWND